MGDIILQNNPVQGVTIISNQFIDQYMPKSNGEFVKVYFYLLRAIQGSQTLDLAQIADVFDCTERDVLRALRYWEKEGLLTLSFQNHRLTGISFCSPADAVSDSHLSLASTESTKADPVCKPETSPKPKPLTPDQIKSLQDRDEVRQFLYIAEQYLGRTLSRTDIDHLLYYYSELHFSSDLIEYLVEYCVSKGSRSTRYIETVALAWAEEGITTVAEAKKSTNLYNKNYFSILKALGIKNRNPVEMEQQMMDSWLNDLGFTLELITEACQRTVIQTGQASFPYVDKILKGWHKRGVKHLSDLTALDQEHRQKAAKMPSREPKQVKAQADYPHRSYNYEEIKKSIFNQ